MEESKGRDGVDVVGGVGGATPPWCWCPPGSPCPRSRPEPLRDTPAGSTCCLEINFSHWFDQKIVNNQQAIALVPVLYVTLVRVTDPQLM